MQRDELKEWLLSEQETVFEGWDFTYLDGRWDSSPLPWNYETIVRDVLRPDYRLLDMGTGDGEFLINLCHEPKLTYATESYPPNINLCEKKLTPLGIKVVSVTNDSEIAFGHRFFDMIINRHESYDVDEVKRMLKDDGYFITQQVAAGNNHELSERMTGKHEALFSQHDMDNCIKELKDKGFAILYSDQADIKTRFYDTGALVYYAKIISWEFPGFSVENCFDNLVEIHEEIKRTGWLQTAEKRFIIVAKKTKEELYD